MPNQDRSLVRLPRADAATLAMTAAFAVLALGGIVAADEPEYAVVTEADVAPRGVAPPQLPADIRQRFAGQTLTVAYDVYLAPDGHVAKIAVVTSVPELDPIAAAWLTNFK